MRHRKLVINSALVVAVLTLAALGYLTVVGPSRSTPASVRTVSVTRGNVTAAVSASGNVTSAMNLGVSFTDCTGPLTTISVKPGQVVSQGQTLATVDPSKAQTTLNNAQAQLAAVQGSASGAGAGAATASQAALTNAQQAVAADQQALADCTLTAPVRGTVITVNGVLGAPPATSAASASSTSTSSGGAKGSTGATGATGDGSSAGSVASSPSSATSSEGGFITVSDLGQLQIKGAFSESDVSAVAPGQQATVVFPALTDANDPGGITATGIVTSVDLSSVVTNNVVTYGVTVSLSSPSPRIKLGETGNATVTTAMQSGVLAVPSNAITTVGATKTVTVQSGTSTQVVPVQVGIAGNGLTEITSGVSEGQKLVLPSATPSSSPSGGFPRRGGGGAGGVAGRLGGGS